MKSCFRPAFWLIILSLIPLAVHAQWHPPREGLKRIYFNLYTDSIKTIMAYYVNVDAEYRNGSFLPMDTSVIRIIADVGTMSGNEWRAPQVINFEKVTFRASVKDNPAIHDEVTVWLKRAKDPRDAPGYDEKMDLPTVPDDVKKRRR